jgi:hypothetical protein
MTLTQYKETNRLRWHDVARKLTEQGCGPIYEGRLNRLRSGKAPTSEERAALYNLTDGEVTAYSEVE